MVDDLKKYLELEKKVRKFRESEDYDEETEEEMLAEMDKLWYNFKQEVLDFLNER